MPTPPLTGRLLWLLPIAGAAAALIATNPGPAEFEAFAAEQLVGLISKELCSPGGLPLTAQLLVRDCPALIHSQRALLGRLAAQASQRTDLGLFSLYTTEIGGQTVLPGLQIPRLRAVTLAGAGQLTVLQSSSHTDPTER
ncbi:MAG: hypothetical protein RLZZ423_102 [Cyanobacteriota bacterium]|jgi:hypothetical protein